jgi:hypothetical protein
MSWRKAADGKNREVMALRKQLTALENKLLLCEAEYLRHEAREVYGCGDEQSQVVVEGPSTAANENLDGQQNLESFSTSCRYSLRRSKNIKSNSYSYANKKCDNRQYR